MEDSKVVKVDRDTFKVMNNHFIPIKGILIIILKKLLKTRLMTNNKYPILKDSIFQIKGKIGTLKFNRDDLRNALTGTFLIDDLVKTAEFVNNEKNISVLIITGEGKAFSSGGNIKEMFKKNSSFSGK